MKLENVQGIGRVATFSTEREGPADDNDEAEREGPVDDDDDEVAGALF